jgi:hypothetical protein
VSYDGSVSGQEWINVAAIASWTVRRRKSAFPTWTSDGAQYKFALDDPGNGGLGKSDQSDEIILLKPGTNGGWRYKNTIAHELGHSLQFWANAPSSILSDTSLDDASCPSGYGYIHKLVSKEYQSAAILEGMASWVAAVAFNNVTQGDCRKVINDSVTWYLGASISPLPYSCEGDVDGDAGAELSFGVSGADYFHETHGFSPNQVTCTDTTPNTGVAVELDWERFLWDLVTKQGVTFGEIVQAFDDASPEAWNTLVPRDEFRDALEAELGTSAPWNNASYGAARNGVDQ